MEIREVVNISLESPWKLYNEIFRFVCLPFARLQFSLARIKWGKNWKIYGLPILQITKGSKVNIGDNLQLRSTKQSNPLSPFHPVVISTRSKNAQIIIGNNFSMTGGSVVAEKQIKIGSHVMVGANCLMTDTDFHPLNSGKRKIKPLAGKTSSIEIKNNIFIGTQAMILKGVKIASGSVVGARAVVTKKFLNKAILAGNPAKRLKNEI